MGPDRRVRPRRCPAYWDELQEKEWFQSITGAAGADDKIAEALKDLAAGLPDAASALLGVAGGVFGSVLSLVTLTFLALFLLMERPTITDWLFGFAPPASEARWRPVLEDSIRAVSSSLIGNVAISIVAATVAGVSAWIFGLPFPLVLAVITGLLDLIPQVGATIAAVILTLVALTVSTEAAIAMVIIQLIYQQLENYVVYPIVYRQAVELTGFTTIVSVLIAGSLLGVVGAILAVPFAAVIKTVVRRGGPPAARLGWPRSPSGREARDERASLMCRWMAYRGQPIPIETLLYKTKHSLIEQSRHAPLGVETFNGDGFGVGWYTDAAEAPGGYRSLMPAWSDHNLREPRRPHPLPAVPRARARDDRDAGPGHQLPPVPPRELAVRPQRRDRRFHEIRRDLVLAVDPPSTTRSRARPTPRRCSASP